MIADNREYNLGIVSKKGGAVIGSGRISVGGKLAVLWREEFPDGTLKDYTAEFNSSELADVAGKVKGMKFTYLGNQSWQLEVFGASHMYSKDLLKTAKSVDSKEVVEETKENGGQ